MPNFQNIPVLTFLVPGVYGEVQDTNANTALTNQNSLIIAQMQSSGIAVGNVPVQISSVSQAATQFGPNSMAVNDVKAYLAIDPGASLYVLGLPDNAAGTAATGNIVVSNTSVTQSGTFTFNIAGFQCQTGVTAGQAYTTIATNIAASLNALPNAPFTASATGGTATVTAIHKGVAAGDLPIYVNFNGAKNNEFTPLGMTYTVNQVSGGTGDPDPTSALANLGNMNYDFISFPYTGSTALTAIENWVSDLSGRWSYLSQAYGGVFSARKDTYSNLTTWGQTNNNQHLDVLAYYDSPIPAFIAAAMWTAANASSLRVNPAIPVGGAGDGVLLQGFLAPPQPSQFTIAEMQTLLADGLSTYWIKQDQTVRVGRSITTYQTNGNGSPDNSYKDINVPYILMSCLRQFRTFYSSNYGRKSIVADGTPIPFGSPAVTPSTIKAGTIGFYSTLVDQGLCQNPLAFNAAVQVVIPPQNPTSVQVYLPLVLANPLIDIFMLVNFTRS
jgi:phage tail sheath gpL-like